MKRNTSFVFSIIMTAFLLVQVVLGIITLVNNVDSFSYDGLFIALIAIIIVVASLVFNIFMIPISISSPGTYKKYNPIIIVAIVFNFLMLLVSLFMYIALCQVYYLFVFAIDVFTNIMYIIDKNTEKERVKVYKSEQNLNPPKVQEPLTEANKLQSKINKLIEMKEQGLISDDEFNKLKMSYINKEIEG